MTDSRRILHIGKTGGTSISAMLAALRDRLDPESAATLPTMLTHRESRRPWRDEQAVRHRYAAVFRDPDQRYASGFMSRLRQGRPQASPGTRLWSPGEAAAFRWFREPNALFEALGSSDDAERSAAWFSMDAIFHLQRDHTWYLGSADEFRAVSDRFWFIRPLGELSSHLDELLPDSTEAVREVARSVFSHAHVAPYPAPQLSSRAREMLRLARPLEYALHEELVAEHARRAAR